MGSAQEYAAGGPPASLSDVFLRQSALNKLCGCDTSAVWPAARGDVTLALSNEFTFSYKMALISEMSELQDCVLWKHWTTEAKAGRRFEIVDLQNARVEAIDILFFLMSIVECLGWSPDDVHIDDLDKPLDIDGRRVCEALMYMHTALGAAFDVVNAMSVRRTSLSNLFFAWTRICWHLAMDAQKVFDLYHQKYRINVERQLRGTSQVGDTFREVENRSVV